MAGNRALRLREKYGRPLFRNNQIVADIHSRKALNLHPMKPLFLTILAAALFTTASVAQSANPCDDVPTLNTEVLTYVRSQVGKKVARGECWDLAAGALNTTGAKWDGQFGFGRHVDPKEDCIYPGDILQFDNVVLVEKSATGTRTEQMPKHTAIIYTVHGTGRYTIAHQNTSFSGRKVGLSEIDLANRTKGRIRAYRPVN
jgi:hypothetical protein